MPRNGLGVDFNLLDSKIQVMGEVQVGFRRMTKWRNRFSSGGLNFSSPTHSSSGPLLLSKLISRRRLIASSKAVTGFYNPTTNEITSGFFLTH